MRSRPTTALIIRSFNEEAHIGRLLTGVSHQTHQPDEIIVVDSGSTDATTTIAAAFGASIVHIAPHDFSFGRALNYGIRSATADIVILASAHVYPTHTTWIERLVEPFSDEAVGLTYGRQVAPEEASFSEGRLLERWFPAESIPRQDDPFCNNANAAIRRSLWTQNEYDEHLTGLEDLAWATWLLSQGGVLSYRADAPVVHVHQQTFRQIVNRYRREAIAHKAIDESQDMSATDAIRLASVNLFGDVRSALRRGVLLRVGPSILKFRIGQFYGAYRGFQQEGSVSARLRRRFYYPENGGAPRDIDRVGEESTRINYDEENAATVTGASRP
jgi:glycosyltransferase involved in cell wall biosynthesis